MPYEPFPNLFPKRASTETRGFTFSKHNGYGMPMGQFFFIECYCTDVDCDCRNVLITVIDGKTQKIKASISYGWETIEFYRVWMRHAEDDDTDDEGLENLKGPALKHFNTQSRFADQWLDIFRQMILSDMDYAERLKRHYKLVKNKVEDRNRNKMKK